MSIDQVTEKRKPGRPRKTESRAERHVTEADKAPEVARPVRKRNKMMDHYVGPLHIANPDPDYVYRWTLDRSENGANILKRVANDWEFVKSDEGLQISQSHVYHTKGEGSIYRYPASRTGNEFYYLMKIRADWYDEDQQEKQDKIDRTEQGLFQIDKHDGQYGARNSADGD